MCTSKKDCLKRQLKTSNRTLASETLGIFSIQQTASPGGDPVSHQPTQCHGSAIATWHSPIYL